METADIENVKVLRETIHLRLGLELMCWDSNPAKTRVGTLTDNILMRTTHLVSGLTEAQVFEFWLSHHRKNSVRDKVIAEKWIYLERNTFHRQECGPSQKEEAA